MMCDPVSGTLGTHGASSATGQLISPNQINERRLPGSRAYLFIFHRLGESP